MNYKIQLTDIIMLPVSLSQYKWFYIAYAYYAEIEIGKCVQGKS